MTEKYPVNEKMNLGALQPLTIKNVCFNMTNSTSGFKRNQIVLCEWLPERERWTSLSLTARNYPLLPARKWHPACMYAI